MGVFRKENAAAQLFWEPQQQGNALTQLFTEIQMGLREESRLCVWKPGMDGTCEDDLVIIRHMKWLCVDREEDRGTFRLSPCFPHVFHAGTANFLSILASEKRFMSDRQKHDSQIDNSDWVEIWFPIEKDEDGYPESRSWEGLWSSPLEESFEIQSVPFYLKNVSRGDTVNADEGEFLEFAHVAHRGGHNTYRLLMHEASREQVIEALRELESKGLTVELNETGILIAVDVSIAVHQQEIDAYLIAGKEQGRWEMQDGYLHTITVA